MLISTTEELRAFLPSHVFRNLDTMLGFFENSEHDFLRERIGEPLLNEANSKYIELFPDGIVPQSGISSSDQTPDHSIDNWRTFISLCQRCIVYDAFARAADISAVSPNDMGLNVSSSENYDAASDKLIDRYKSSLNREAHAASNRLLIKLEEWERLSRSLTDSEEELDTDNASIVDIISLWKESPTYYLVDGLLFNTATEFHRFVNIYDSRDRFIELLPDIRYCQELHIECEIGTDLLYALKQKNRDGNMNAVENRAYVMLQRTLSLYVEARSKMFNRPPARDEACGYMNRTLEYLKAHQLEIADNAAWKLSPLYDELLWKESQSQNDSTSQPPVHNTHDHNCYHHPENTVLHGHIVHGNDDASADKSSCHCGCSRGDNMLITSLI